MRILAIANQKGGCAKTATCHALGVALANEGRRVLLVDCDPQSSLTGACGVNDAAGASLAEVLGGAAPGSVTLQEVIRELPASQHNGKLSLVPSDIALATTELGLVSRMGRESVLKRALATVATDYDIALLDCPPSLGLLTVAALTAAEAILVPVQCQAQDLRGLRLFLGTLDQIRDNLNPSLAVLGIVPTFFDGRLAHHKEALALMIDSGLPVLPVKIGRSIKVAEAAAAGQSVIGYAPTNPQETAYLELAKVVSEWLQNAQR